MSDGVDEWTAWMDKNIQACLLCIRTHIDLVLDHTRSLRPGHDCVISLPTPETGYQAGNRSLHIPVEWDDGKEWLLRIKHDANIKTQASRRMMMETEVATMSYMARHGLPVPDAWACPPLRMPESDSVYMWCLMERITGKPFSQFHDRDPDVRRNVATDLADFYIKLSALPFSGVGALQQDPAGADKVSIGPSDLYLPLRDDTPTDPPTANLLGPWQVSAEHHVAFLNWGLRDLKPHQLLLCLWVLEARRILGQDETLQQKQPTYICHGDPNGDHILKDEQGHITGIIDWEFCVTRPFSEAFQAPIGFIPFPELLKGAVELAPMESLLVGALRDKKRDDLAECVLKGRQWHLLRMAPGFTERVELTNAFRRLWLGETARQFETVEAWREWALDEFKGAPELQPFL